MPDHPRLTVGIPTYNAAKYLPAAIDSVLQQEVDDCEIVIVDNASTDETQAVVEAYADPRIRYFRNDTNMGMSGSWNRCLAEARGDYFKFVCADDALLPGVLARQMAVLDGEPNVVFVTCNNINTDDELNPESRSSAVPGRCSGERAINTSFSGLNNYVGAPSNQMFRMSAAQGIAVDASYRYILDVKLAAQILQRGDYASIDDDGCLYRVHSASETVSNTLGDIKYVEFARLIDELNWWNLCILVQFVRKGGAKGRAIARRHFFAALKPSALWRAALAFLDVARIRSLNIKQLSVADFVADGARKTR